ncbi:MAG: peptidoglycan-binding protein [Actinomycetota bacterium]
MILCKNGHENEEGATYCRVCFVYIDSSTAEHVEPPAEHVEPPAEPGPPTIALGDREVLVPLGGEAACEVWIRNDGPAEARYGVEVEGPAAAWAVVRDAPVTVAGGDEGKAAVVFRPPATEVASEPVRFLVKVTDLARPGLVATGEGTVEVDVDVKVEAGAELVPVASRGATAGKHRVVVRNKAALPVVAAVTAAGAHDAVTIDVDPPALTVAPAGEASANVVVRPLTPFTWGKPRVHRFDVLVMPAGADPVALQGTMTQVARVPKWAAAIAAVVAGLGGVSVALDDGTGPPQVEGETVSFAPEVVDEGFQCPAEGIPGVITEGAQGDAVRALHVLLERRGSVPQEGDALEALKQEARDRFFGPETTVAVRHFQGEVHGGLEADGIVGPRTWEALCSG